MVSNMGNVFVSGVNVNSNAATTAVPENRNDGSAAISVICNKQKC